MKCKDWNIIMKTNYRKEKNSKIIMIKMKEQSRIKINKNKSKRKINKLKTWKK